jgi:hypothetical protein
MRKSRARSSSLLSPRRWGTRHSDGVATPRSASFGQAQGLDADAQRHHQDALTVINRVAAGLADERLWEALRNSAFVQRWENPRGWNAGQVL